MSIRSRLLLLATAMLLPYLLYVGISTYAARQDAITHALSHNEAEARRVAAQFAAYVEQVQALLASVETAVGDDITTVTENDNKLKRLLAAVPGAVSWVSIVDPAGNITASSAVPLAHCSARRLRRAAPAAAEQSSSYGRSPPLWASAGSAALRVVHEGLRQGVRAVTRAGALFVPRLRYPAAGRPNRFVRACNPFLGPTLLGAGHAQNRSCPLAATCRRYGPAAR